MSVKIVSLSEVSEQVRGVSYSKGDACDEPRDGYLPIFRANNITDAGLTFDDLIYVPPSKVSERQKIREGDIVVAASSGSLDVVGKAAPVLQSFSGSFGAFCKVVRPNKKVYPGYLAHFFTTPEYRHRISNLASGANINNLRNEHLANLQIPLPPLEEQKRIAAILDKAAAIRRKRRESLRLADQFLRSVFLEMFGDPVTNPKGLPIGKIGDLLESVNYGTSKKADSQSGKFPVLRMGNITYEGNWDFSDLKYVDLNSKEERRHLVYSGQLLFNRTNSRELVGKTAVYREESPMAFAGYLIRGIPKSDADSEYISAYLNSIYGKKTLEQMCKNIIGMANINAKEMQSIRILIPPFSEQRKFGNLVRKMKSYCVQWKAAVSMSQALFESLQQRVFRS